MKLEKEFQYYLEHQDELVLKYNNKFLLIKEESILGVYDSKQDAYDFVSQKNELGNVLIQQCSSGNTGTTQTFHSRAIVGIIK